MNRKVLQEFLPQHDPDEAFNKALEAKENQEEPSPKGYHDAFVELQPLTKEALEAHLQDLDKQLIKAHQNHDHKLVDQIEHAKDKALLALSDVEESEELTKNEFKKFTKKRLN